MTSTAWRTASSRRTGRSSFRSLGTLSTSLNIGTMIESFIGWLPPLSSAGSHAGEGIGQRSRTPHLVGRATDRAAPEISLGADKHAILEAGAPVQERPILDLDVVADDYVTIDIGTRTEDAAFPDHRSFAHTCQVPDARPLTDLCTG